MELFGYLSHSPNPTTEADTTAGETQLTWDQIKRRDSKRDGYPSAPLTMCRFFGRSCLSTFMLSHPLETHISF